MFIDEKNFKGRGIKKMIKGRMKQIKNEILERAKGIEPSTPTLARLCSTAELRPLILNLNEIKLLSKKLRNHYLET